MKFLYPATRAFKGSLAHGGHVDGTKPEWASTHIETAKSCPNIPIKQAVLRDIIYLRDAVHSAINFKIVRDESDGIDHSGCCWIGNMD